jgi:citrate lyase beta subunit
MADPYQLGASLYVPALHPKLAQVLSHQAHPALKSVIVCTEDAVAERDLDRAVHHLAEVLPTLNATPGLLRFVRVRNLTVMQAVLAMPGSSSLDGFVLPKISAATMLQYTALLAAQPAHTHQLLMPTLETMEVFEPDAMRDLRTVLMQDSVRPRILALRIGGNDLLRILGMRRPRNVTLYETPLGALMAQLVLIFRPYGFALSAPVCDILDDESLLIREAEHDLAYGFCGKTAVHPSQVATIEAVFKVKASEMQAARQLMAPDCPAVFQLGGTMYEAAVHGPWAQHVFSRAQHFGVELPYPVSK